MKILFFCTAFNSLSQRLALVLKARGHYVTVELALSPELMTTAAELALPDIIICPFLTKRVPQAVYTRWLTLIVHPGPPGDAGPSALDWTLIGDLGECSDASAELSLINASHNMTKPRRKMRSHWGVTVLQAIEAFDAGPVWAFDQFELDAATSKMTKSDLYRGPVTRAAVNAVLAAIEIIKIVCHKTNGQNAYPPDMTPPEFARTHCVSSGMPFQGGNTHERPLLKASSRDFLQLNSQIGDKPSAEVIVQRIRCGDSQPGILTNFFGTPMFAYNATVQKDPLPQHIAERARLNGARTILATRDGAVLVDVGADNPIWIGYLRRSKTKTDKYLQPKLPATMALKSAWESINRSGLLTKAPEWSVLEADEIDASTPWKKRPDTYQQVWVEIEAIGNSTFKVGYIYSEFYNGAFSTSQCEMLLKAINWTLAQPDLKAIVMLGGEGYFSNGIALNVIEGSEDPSAEGWANINAIDDCVQALLAPAGILTFSAIRGNVAAGGLAFATAADIVLCAENAVLNPHYRGIGLYGSEWHTYSWYERCGADVASRFAREMMPMSSVEAQKLGLVDHVIGHNKMNSNQLLSAVKSIVQNVMTANAAATHLYKGATWTQPLRPISDPGQYSLPEYMLRNKAKYLAYTFAGNGQDHLSISEHFQLYRERELAQMTLDFFHPQRNNRFATRCTAFVRKLVPTSTPFRFALHRRHENGQWAETTPGPISCHDEEELESFDSLGSEPASAAIPRLPSSRPEYTAQPDKSALQTRPDMPRNNSTESTASSLYSESRKPSLSSSTTSSTVSTGAWTPVNTRFPSDLTEVWQYHSVIAEQHPQYIQPTQLFTGEGLNPESKLPTSNEVSKPTGEPEVLWSCYYSESGSETATATAERLQLTSEALRNMLPATLLEI